MHPSRTALLLWIPLLLLRAEAQTLYSFGNPTADEQSYIELINRARSNPPQEGTRLGSTTDTDVVEAYNTFGVNLTMMRTEHNAIAAVPPLAPNAILTGTARSHSAWMYANARQEHAENGVSPSARVTAAGYTWNAMGENIFASTVSPFYGHASFSVDWGTGTSVTSGGMQNPRGHRTRLYNPVYREIGVGMAYGTKNQIGPQLVTQDFATHNTNPTLATGVAYYDVNGNSFYDVGEGISGLRVDVSGASYYCQTATGGGWVVPVPTTTTAAARTVTFAGNGINQTASINVPANTNAKADLKLAYPGPVITSSATAYVRYPYNLTFNAVPGATSYKWRRWTTVAAPDDNAENLLGAVLSLLGAQPSLSILVKQQGLSSYQIVNNGEYGARFIEMAPLYRGQASASMNFQSRITYSTSSERFKVQVKEEGTQVWLDLDSQTGLDGAGQSAFGLRTVSLASMVNKNFRLRFALTYSSGAYYPPSLLTTRGWFIDAIQFDNVQQLQNEVLTTLATSSGSYTPSATGSFIHAVQPVISGIEFPATSGILNVIAGTPPPASGFPSWAAGFESSNSLPAGTIANSSGDPDKDGRVNLIEYAFGTSPVQAVEPTPRLPVASRTATNAVVEYKTDTSLSDLVFQVEASTNLSTWKAPGEAGAPSGFVDQVLSTNGTIETHRAVVPLNSVPKVFMRVKVTKSP